MRKAFSAVALILVLLFSMVASFYLVNLGNSNFMVPPPPALSRIYIKADGSVEPSTAPVQHVGNVYTLTADISDYVLDVQRDNIVIDGAGFSLIGEAHEDGVVLSSRSNIAVKNLNVEQFNAGIYVSGCTSCTIDGNIVTNNLSGIKISGNSSNNIISGNVLKDNTHGISIHSGANLFRNNVMQNNSYNLAIATDLKDTNSESTNDIDGSNTVDGKPVCYWVNQHNRIVPSGYGYVALIDCTGITVQNLTLAKNGRGVLLISTHNSTISHNIISGNGDGVWVDNSSSHITIVENIITANIDSGISFIGSNNNEVANNSITSNHKDGILIRDSDGVIIFGNTIGANWINGINLHNNSQITISKNHIANHKTDSGTGIWCAQTSNSRIYKNIVKNNKVGISILGLSKDSIILENIIQDNDEGIYFTTGYEESNNTFRNNQLNLNEHNIRFDAIYEGSAVQDIDSSNMVNGKPVYYWVSQSNRAVPSDAGYIALINCSNITIQNVNISNNWQGIILYNTTNSLITKNNFSGNNANGIYTESSSNNFFSENRICGNGREEVLVGGSNNIFVQNYIANNGGNGISLGAKYSSIIGNNITANKAAGIRLNGAEKCAILGNYVAKNGLGILLYWGTSQTQVIANTITENYGWGMRIEGSEINSTIYHNNFINNIVEEGLQVSIPWPADSNTWDNGEEGNYWSDYTFRYANTLEVDNAGVGNTLYVINLNNIDHHPLMSPFDISTIPIPQWETPENQQQESFPTIIVVASIATITIIGIGLLVYFKKYRRN